MFSFLYTRRLLFAHSSPIVATKGAGNIIGRLSGVMAFGVFITEYDVESSCRCLEVMDSTIDNVLAKWIPMFLYLSIVSFVVVMFAVRLLGFFSTCNASH